MKIYTMIVRFKFIVITMIAAMSFLGGTSLLAQSEGGRVGFGFTDGVMKIWGKFTNF